MRVLVDTSVWSLALRRRPKDLSAEERACVFLLRDLIVREDALLLGVVRQELLSGVPDPEAFERLREYLRDFDDEPPLTEDYEEAARCNNACRSAGIASALVDMLLCAVAMRSGTPILTMDRDFGRYARHLPVRVPTVPDLQAALRAQRGAENGGE